MKTRIRSPSLYKDTLDDFRDIKQEPLHQSRSVAALFCLELVKLYSMVVSAFLRGVCSFYRISHNLTLFKCQKQHNNSNCYDNMCNT